MNGSGLRISRAAVLALVLLAPAAGAASLDPDEVPALLPLVNPDLTSIVGLAVDRDGDDVGGRLGAAVVPVAGGRPLVFGRLTQGRAWSAMKVPVAVAYLDFRRGSAALGASERRELAATLVRSDNDAAKALYLRMGGERPARARVQAALVAAGDFHTRVNAHFGTSTWRLEDGLEYYRRLAAGCLLVPRDTAYLLGLMRRVVEVQRWGVPRAVGPRVPVAFKGGWGPDARNRYLVEQFALVGRGPSAYLVGAMARPSLNVAFVGDARPYQAGTEMVERAVRLVKQVGARAAARRHGTRCRAPRPSGRNALRPQARRPAVLDECHAAGPVRAGGPVAADQVGHVDPAAGVHEPRPRGQVEPVVAGAERPGSVRVAEDHVLGLDPEPLDDLGGGAQTGAAELGAGDIGAERAEPRAVEARDPGRQKQLAQREPDETAAAPAVGVHPPPGGE